MDNMAQWIFVLFLVGGVTAYASEAAPSHSAPTHGRNEAVESAQKDVLEDVGEKDTKAISETIEEFDRVTTGPKNSVGEQPSPEKI